MRRTGSILPPQIRGDLLLDAIDLQSGPKEPRDPTYK
jgi:hypothetical protein